MTTLSERQQFGRAKNALSDYFVRKLIVPKIYFDVTWNEEQLDLLAIDRTGVGDVHALRFLRSLHRSNGSVISDNDAAFLTAIEEAMKLHSLPAQYRYLVVIDDTGGTLLLQPWETLKERSYADDGIGRVGILYVEVASEDIVVRVVIKPERFRSTAAILALTDEYVATHTADMEYRDPMEYQVSA